MKNADNVNFNEIMKGFYAELKDEKNKEKSGDEIKAMVVKNLAKDPLYYTKNGEFGTKEVGYTTEAPGLGEPKEPKGKYKSSGYGDLKLKESIKRKSLLELMSEEEVYEENAIEEGPLDDAIAAAEKVVAQKKKETADAEKKLADAKGKEASAEAAG